MEDLTGKKITESKENPKKITPSIRTYEGCEYLIYYNKGMHKGNCKNPIHNCR